jgi:hypothetical protein
MVFFVCNFYLKYKLIKSNLLMSYINLNFEKILNIVNNILKIFFINKE